MTPWLSARSFANADQDWLLSPLSSTCRRSSTANGRVTSRPMTSTSATASTTRTHHQPGSRATSRRPQLVKPSRQATTSETTSELQLQARAQRAYSSARAICSGVKTELGSTGDGVPPGTGCHGTSTMARTTNATPPISVTASATRRSGCSRPPSRAKSDRRSRHSAVNAGTVSPKDARSAAGTGVPDSTSR